MPTGRGRGEGRGKGVSSFVPFDRPPAGSLQRGQCTGARRPVEEVPVCGHPALHGGVLTLGPWTVPLGLAIALCRPSPCWSVETAPHTQLPGLCLWTPGPRKPSRRGQRRDPPRTQPHSVPGGRAAAFAGPWPPDLASWDPPVPPTRQGSSPQSAPWPFLWRWGGVPAGGQRRGSLGRGADRAGGGVGLRAGPEQASGAPGGRPPDPAPREQQGGGGRAKAGALLERSPAPGSGCSWF